MDGMHIGMQAKVSSKQLTDSNDLVRASLQLTIQWIHKSDSKWAENGRSSELECDSLRKKKVTNAEF